MRLTFSQHHLSGYEKRWAISHPFTTLKIKKKLPEAMKVYTEVKRSGVLDTLESGGKLDAFRHVYTMAYLARTMNTAKIRKLGIAHEKGDKLRFLKNKEEFGERPDSLACEMDLRNNALGLLIGGTNGIASDEELKQLVIKAIMEGKAWYLKRNSSYQYVDCEGNILHFPKYKGKWAIPKCLIPTNQ